MVMKPIKIGPFLGVNNLLPDTQLRTKLGDWLRSAVNVDLTAAGTIKRRAGFELAQAGGACHSLWSDDGPFGYYADGSALYRVRVGPAGLSRELVRDDLEPGPRLSYARVRDWIYYSNGIDRGILRDGSASSDWGVLPDFTNPGSPAYRWRPMPAGTIVRHHKGRLLVARGSVLYVSEPWAPNVYAPARGYIAFAAAITLVVVFDTGIFVCADRTYWMPGDLTEGMTTVLPHGAIAGSDSYADDANAAIWASPRGLVRGTPDGAAVNLQDKTVATGSGASGATLLREFDGMTKAVAAVSGVEQSAAAARSYMDAEIVRKGVTL